MSQAESVSKLSRHTFVAAPSEKFLLKALLQHWNEQGVRNIALLEPENPSSQLQHYLKQLMSSSNMTLHKAVRYHQNYESILRASKDLFQLHSHQRQGEWAELLRQKKEEAALLETQVKSEELYLAPKIDFDALIVADNAKMVRHFLKIFRYLRLSSPIRLGGTHLWRSEEIVKPWDDLLEGAHFVDFIDEYHNLPSFLHAATMASVDKARNPSALQHFVPASMLASIDFQMLGYKTAMLALEVVLPTFKNGRTSISATVDRYILGAKRRLDHSENAKEIPWETYVFRLSKGRIWPLHSAQNILATMQGLQNH